jgi:uncharacterized protein
MITRRLAFALPTLLLVPRRAAAEDWVNQLIEAGQEQLGVTTLYDPAYVKLDFPGGDVPMERGVCTDVVIRAYRRAFGFDHQRAVNADMKSTFGAYPKRWGARTTDRNIDHRRVPNLQVFWKRKKAALPVPESVREWQPGDLATLMLPGNLPHVGILVSERDDETGAPLMLHNIGAGARVENVLPRYEITGRYRFSPALFG